MPVSLHVLRGGILRTLGRTRGLYLRASYTSDLANGFALQGVQLVDRVYVNLWHDIDGALPNDVIEVRFALDGQVTTIDAQAPWAYAGGSATLFASGSHTLTAEVWFTGSDPDVDPPDEQVAATFTATTETVSIFYDTSPDMLDARPLESVVLLSDEDVYASLWGSVSGLALPPGWSVQSKIDGANEYLSTTRPYHLRADGAVWAPEIGAHDVSFDVDRRNGTLPVTIGASLNVVVTELLLVYGETIGSYPDSTQPLHNATTHGAIHVFVDTDTVVGEKTIDHVRLINDDTAGELWNDSTYPYGDTPLDLADGTRRLHAEVTFTDASVVHGPQAVFTVDSTPADVWDEIKGERAGLALDLNTGYNLDDMIELVVTNLNSTGAGSFDAALNTLIANGGGYKIRCTDGLSGTITWTRATAEMPDNGAISFRMGNIILKSTQNEDMFHFHGNDNFIMDGVEIDGPSGGEKDPIQVGADSQPRSAGHTYGLFFNRIRGSNAGDEIFGITEPKGEPQQVTIMRSFVNNPKGMLISCDAGGGTDPDKAQWIKVDLILCKFFDCIGSNRNPKLKGVFARVSRCLIEESQFGTQLMDANDGASAAGHTILQHCVWKSTVDGGKGGVFSGEADGGLSAGILDHLLAYENLHFDLSNSPNFNWQHGAPEIVSLSDSRLWNGRGSTAPPSDPNDVLGLAANPTDAQIEADVESVAGVW